jgi:hypothetical protein
MGSAPSAFGWDQFQAVNGLTPGGFFWVGDEWLFLDSYYGSDELNLVSNVIVEFCGAGNKNIWFANTGWLGNNLKAGLEGLGHTVTRAGVSDLITLSVGTYDFALLWDTSQLAGSSALEKNQNILNFVQSGGGAMTTMGHGNGEGTRMLNMLAWTGMSYDISPYVFNSPPDVGPTGVGVPGTYFVGVGQSLHMVGAGKFTKTTPTASPQGSNVTFDGTDGVDTYTVFGAWRP